MIQVGRRARANGIWIVAAILFSACGAEQPKQMRITATVDPNDPGLEALVQTVRVRYWSPEITVEVAAQLEEKELGEGVDPTSTAQFFFPATAKSVPQSGLAYAEGAGYPLNRIESIPIPPIVTSSSYLILEGLAVCQEDVDNGEGSRFTVVAQSGAQFAFDPDTVEGIEWAPFVLVRSKLGIDCVLAESDTRL